ncbi:hypothetical protein Godav_003697 [Gossypium davidsonii]|uniref:Uncharacterized protein n=2 Tax=Gossypium TaxID=3633 RepID=A0A7J8SJ85_GOSDV|nr:hypothetical protein [Gossypium davidsonii]
MGLSTQDMRSCWICPSTCIETYRSRQFIPAVQGLVQCEFRTKVIITKKRVHEISNQTHKMKRFAANLMTTPEYDWWWGKRINDNVPSSCEENTRPIEEHLQVIPSELEIVKQYFEKKSLELGKMIEKFRNSVIELKVSLTKIEKLKGTIEKLEVALQNFELRVELLETSNEHWKEQLEHS